MDQELLGGGASGADCAKACSQAEGEARCLEGGLIVANPGRVHLKNNRKCELKNVVLFARLLVSCDLVFPRESVSH